MATGEAWQNFTFSSPVKRWALDFILIENKEGQEPVTLDAPGFRCLALITTDLLGDLKKLTDVGGTDVTEPFVIPMNHKMLQVALLRGPGNEIIELIEFNTSKT